MRNHPLVLMSFIWRTVAQSLAPFYCTPILISASFYISSATTLTKSVVRSRGQLGNVFLQVFHPLSLSENKTGETEEDDAATPGKDPGQGLVRADKLKVEKR